MLKIIGTRSVMSCMQRNKVQSAAVITGALVEQNAPGLALLQRLTKQIPPACSASCTQESVMASITPYPNLMLLVL